MGEAAEHHVRELFNLFLQGAVHDRMTVTMYRAPPGCHAVDQLPPIGQGKVHAAGGCNRIDRRGLAHGGIGMPYVLAVYVNEVL